MQESLIIKERCYEEKNFLILLLVFLISFAFYFLRESVDSRSSKSTSSEHPKTKHSSSELKPGQKNAGFKVETDQKETRILSDDRQESHLEALDEKESANLQGLHSFSKQKIYSPKTLEQFKDFSEISSKFQELDSIEKFPDIKKWLADSLKFSIFEISTGDKFSDVDMRMEFDSNQKLATINFTFEERDGDFGHNTSRDQASDDIFRASDHEGFVEIFITIKNFWIAHLILPKPVNAETKISGQYFQNNGFIGDIRYE